MSAQDETARQAASPVSAAEFAARLAALSPSRTIAVAFSGGPDSLALLVLAAQWAGRRKSVSLHAFTVDHGLRAASAAEAKRAAAMAKELGVPHRILRWKGEKPASGIQAAAREARYRLLLEACRAAGASELLAAHHLEDQAETFLLRLARGSGVDGLAGMASARPLAEDGSVRLLRPLLDLPRERLLATVRRSGLEPVEDPSNENEAFDRVKARKLLSALSSLGLDAGRLARTAALMAQAREALEAETAALLAVHARLSPLGYVEMDEQAFQAAPRDIGLRLLAAVIRTIGGHGYAPRLEALEGVYAALREGTLGRGRTLAGVKLAMTGGQLLATREVAAAVAAPGLVLGPGGEGLWDNRFRITLARAPRGAKIAIQALGQEGVRHLSAGGIAIPAVPRTALFALPGAWRQGRLVAAPHMGTLDPTIELRASLRPSRGISPENAPKNT